MAVKDTRKQKNHDGNLTEKAAEAQPWETLCLDLKGPYHIRRKGKKPLRLQAVTMIDPATRWFGVAEICRTRVLDWIYGIRSPQLYRTRVLY